MLKLKLNFNLQVDSLPYQWLMVKNKTIIGPKSTEEQKVLLVPPQPGVYQCILSVCSWPASAETELAARANIFAKRVVLIAVAENPALAVSDSNVKPSMKSWNRHRDMQVMCDCCFHEIFLCGLID